jgi:hypothetical protein
VATRAAFSRDNYVCRKWWAACRNLVRYRNNSWSKRHSVVLLHDYAGEAAHDRNGRAHLQHRPGERRNLRRPSSPHEENAPLTTSGFKSEDEARAWIEAERNRALG